MQTKEKLAAALLSSGEHPGVKLLNITVGDEPLTITAAQALLRLLRGGYEVKVKKHRVIWLRVAVPAKPWQHCWRVDMAAVLEPSLEYGRTTEWGN